VLKRERLLNTSLSQDSEEDLPHEKKAKQLSVKKTNVLSHIYTHLSNTHTHTHTHTHICTHTFPTHTHTHTYTHTHTKHTHRETDRDRDRDKTEGVFVSSEE